MGFKYKDTHNGSGQINGYMNECADQLGNIKSPEGPQKTTKAHDDRTILMGKKNSFTPSSHVKNMG